MGAAATPRFSQHPTSSSCGSRVSVQCSRPAALLALRTRARLRASPSQAARSPTTLMRPTPRRCWFWCSMIRTARAAARLQVAPRSAFGWWECGARRPRARAASSRWVGRARDATRGGRRPQATTLSARLTPPPTQLLSLQAGWPAVVAELDLRIGDVIELQPDGRHAHEVEGRTRPRLALSTGREAHESQAPSAPPPVGARASPIAAPAAAYPLITSVPVGRPAVLPAAAPAARIAVLAPHLVPGARPGVFASPAAAPPAAVPAPAAAPAAAAPPPLPPAPLPVAAAAPAVAAMPPAVAGLPTGRLAAAAGAPPAVPLVTGAALVPAAAAVARPWAPVARAFVVGPPPGLVAGMLAGGVPPPPRAFMTVRPQLAPHLRGIAQVAVAPQPAKAEEQHSTVAGVAVQPGAREQPQPQEATLAAQAVVPAKKRPGRPRAGDREALLSSEQVFSYVSGAKSLEVRARRWVPAASSACSANERGERASQPPTPAPHPSRTRTPCRRCSPP